MTPVPPFPWAEAMGFAFTRLHLSPDAFWAMTPLELAAAIRFVRPVSLTPDRSAFAALMQTFPDTPQHEEVRDGYQLG